MEVNLTTDNFEQEVIRSQLPALVDFWAPWCGPCQMIAPYIKQIAKAYAGKLKVCKINVDEASELATKYAIMSIPALMVFKEGKVMEKRVGLMKKDALEDLVKQYI